MVLEGKIELGNLVKHSLGKNILIGKTDQGKCPGIMSDRNQNETKVQFCHQMRDWKMIQVLLLTNTL